MVEMKKEIGMSGRMAAAHVRRCSLAFWVLALLAIGAAPAAAQFNSGSSGIHGAFPPSPVYSTTGPTYIVWNMDNGLVRYCSSYDLNIMPDTCATGSQLGQAQIPNIPAGGLTTGIFEFTNFVLPDRASVPLQVAIILVGNSRNNPLTILSQGDIRLGVFTYIYAVGLPGVAPVGVGAPGAGGRGGPGGFAGGNGGVGGTTAVGGSPGYGPAGGAGGILVAGSLGGANAGISPASALLTPVVGGSGGGGSTGIPGSGGPCAFGPAGGAGSGGGGGGGGVLLSATNEIALSFGASNLASIYTTGGAGAGLGGTTCGAIFAGSGEPGSVRLVASKISGNGTISSGRLRIEATTNTFIGGVPNNTSFTQFPARAIPTAQPGLRITAVNGVAAPASPVGSLAAPDINFPAAINGNVTVNIAGSNIPLGTLVSLRVVPTNGAFTATMATSTALTGTLDSSTATASIAIPPGLGSMTVSATFQITPLFAQLKLPAVDGAAPALAEVVVGKDGASHLYLLGKEGGRVEMTPDMWRAATTTF